MSYRMHDIALLERRVRQVPPAGALIAPALKAAALERRSFAKKLFGLITLDGVVDVEPVWRPLIAALASETIVEWNAPDGVDRSWFKGQLARFWPSSEACVASPCRARRARFPEACSPLRGPEGHD